MRLSTGLAFTIAAFAVVPFAGSCASLSDDCHQRRDCGPYIPPEAGLGGFDGGSGGSSASGGADSGTGGSDACNGECGGATPVCDEDQGACVECTENEHCGGSTAVCDTATHTCVGCLGNGDCDAEAPLCDDTGTCVACLSDADCDDPLASRCDAGVCKPCTASTECAHIEGKTVCDAEAGECVECTGKEYAVCGLDGEGKQLVCDSLERTCSTQTEASRGLCGDCVSDAACNAGKLCVMETFDGEELGYRCVWQRGAEGGAPSLCSEGRPYIAAREDVTSLDGVESDVCVLALSTCKAHQDFRDIDCETSTPDQLDDTLCGEPELEDGLCRLFESDGMGNNAYRCTVPCLANDDCPSGVECDTEASPSQCKLQVTP